MPFLGSQSSYTRCSFLLFQRFAQTLKRTSNILFSCLKNFKKLECYTYVLAKAQKNGKSLKDIWKLKSLTTLQLQNLSTNVKHGVIKDSLCRCSRLKHVNIQENFCQNFIQMVKILKEVYEKIKTLDLRISHLNLEKLQRPLLEMKHLTYLSLDIYHENNQRYCQFPWNNFKDLQNLKALRVVRLSCEASLINNLFKFLKLCDSVNTFSITINFDSKAHYYGSLEKLENQNSFLINVIADLNYLATFSLKYDLKAENIDKGRVSKLIHQVIGEFPQPNIKDLEISLAPGYLDFEQYKRTEITVMESLSKFAYLERLNLNIGLVLLKPQTLQREFLSIKTLEIMIGDPRSLLILAEILNCDVLEELYVSQFEKKYCEESTLCAFVDTLKKCKKLRIFKVSDIYLDNSYNCASILTIFQLLITLMRLERIEILCYLYKQYTSQNWMDLLNEILNVKRSLSSIKITLIPVIEIYSRFVCNLIKSY